MASEFSKNGIPGRIVERCGRVVLIQRHLGNWTGWEVALVKEVPAVIMFGNLVEEHEALPGNEEWGTCGWTKCTEEEARALFMQKVGEELFK